MNTTYNVRIWEIREKTGKAPSPRKPGRKSYIVRWVVAKRQWSRSHATRAMAESFRSDLLSLQRKGEAFNRADGLPVSMSRRANEQNWFDFAQNYIDMKWVRAAAKSRASNSDALASATFAMIITDRGKPSDKTLRKAMTGWAFNTKRREDPRPPEIAMALTWLAKFTVPVSALNDVALMRQVLEQLSLKMDGKPAAAKTIARKRAIVYNALEYGVELKLLEVNRLREIKWTTPKSTKAIDKRVVINPGQARSLLSAVNDQRVHRQPRRSSGPMLVAYFAVMYYAALRPEEAAMLHKSDLQLPESGWGELLISTVAPIAGSAWTDTGSRRDHRHQLKQRARGDARVVPSPPPLTALLHEHLTLYGTASDGRLFRSLTGGDLAESTIARVWRNARKTALTKEEYESPLCKRPYDLRHACVSTWLSGGVQSTQIAEWAGHSVAVLHQIYAKVIAGQEASSRARIERALGLYEDKSETANRPQIAGDRQ